MNEPDFEQSLRALQPAAPSPDLERRIALALDGTLTVRPASLPAAGVLRERPSGWFRLFTGLAWAGAGAVAGVTAVLMLTPAPRPDGVAGTAAAEPVASIFEPAESAREIIASEESDTVYDAQNQPSRWVRYTSIERHTWTNPATGAEMLVEVPREDVVALPVSYQ